MPFEYNWKKIHHLIGPKDVNKKIDTLRQLKSYCNLPKRCTVCFENSDGHKMRYTRFICSAVSCPASEINCEYKMKVLSCQRIEAHVFYRHGNHSAISDAPVENVLTLEMKEVVRELARNDVKPARIRNMLIDKFDLNSSTLPPLKTIQNFVWS